MDAISISSLTSQRDTLDCLFTVWQVFVIVGVGMEGFEAYKELKRIPARWTPRIDEAQYEASGGAQFIPEEKPSWQKQLSFAGWIVLSIGLVAELCTSTALRDIDRSIDRLHVSQIESAIRASQPH